MFFRPCALTVLALFTVSCGGEDSPTQAEPQGPIVTTVSLSSSTLSFNSLGANEQLTAAVKDQNAATMQGVTVTWGSSEEAVATVSSAGLVTSVGNGSATITATSGAAAGSALITVEQVAASLDISSTSVPFASLGDTVRLTAAVTDASGTAIAGAIVTWESSDVAIATVSSTGLVTSVRNGTATITGASGSVTGSATVTVVSTTPPFQGTVYIDPDIITSSDPTALQSLSFAGQGSRTMYDRRVTGWITVNAYLFNASFDDGLTAEIQVNPEFGSAATALPEAQKYAEVFGRLPTTLRTDVETVWIHKGNESPGGGKNFLIHTGRAELFIARGVLEEAFVHEAAHGLLDVAHASAPAWLAAQSADPTFISDYAREWPNREDIAESFLAYLAVRYRSDRISQSLANTILLTIPNRIAYFDDYVPKLMGTGW